MRSRDLSFALDYALVAAVSAWIGIAGAFLASLTPTTNQAAVRRAPCSVDSIRLGEQEPASSTAPDAAPLPEPTETMNAEDLIDADFLSVLSDIESGGDYSAWNRAEDAHGLYQIRPAYLRDANAILGRKMDIWQMHDPSDAAAAVRAYLTRYGNAYAKRTGKPVTREVLARIHNGGPMGAERAATEDYGARFRALWEARHA